LIWALLMPSGLGSVLFLYGAASQVAARYGLEYGEGIVLWQAAHISSPAVAYHPIEQYPYVVFHYTPGFHVAARIVGWVTGDLLIGGRLVTFGSLLGILFALAAIVFRGQSGVADRSARWAGAVTAALLPAALPNVRDWVPHMRVDMFALMLTMVSMWLFLEGQKRPPLRYAAFIGFVAALFAKQTLLSAPLAALIVTAIDSRREAIKCAAVAAVAGLIPLAGLQYATNGQFLTHTFVYNQNAYTIQRAIEMLSANFLNAWPIIVLAVAGLAFALTRAERRTTGDLTVRSLSIYLVCAFGVSWMAGKFGSASNYFLEFNLICCVFAGMAVTAALDQSRRVHLVPRVAMAILVLVAGMRWLPNIANTAFHLSVGSRQLAAARELQARQALDAVSHEPGRVFSWDLMLLMLAKKDIPLEPAIMFELSRAGTWDISPFIDQIRNGEYGLIVTNEFTEWLPNDAVSRAMAAAYVPAAQFGSYTLFRPVPRKASF
jgi:hypothetical protein